MISATPIILCGGSGTRLWPLSRTGFPKQFLCLTDSISLFQLAAQRLAGLGSQNIQVGPPLIVTGEDHRFLALEQLREVGIEMAAALLEPVGRNTAPALTLAALAAKQNGSDPVLIVTPADQAVDNTAAFTAAAQMAIEQAAQGSIVMLGVKPNRPETGYGYIQVEPGGVTSDLQVAFQRVGRFVEKPNAADAQQYLNEGGYFWNAGIFVLKASVWLKALEEFRPDIYLATLHAWSKCNKDANTSTTFLRPGKTEFTAIPAESVDYAVMEKCPGSIFPMLMVPLDAGWSDLGSWDGVWNALPKDFHGNVHLGDVLSIQSKNNFVYASSRLISMVGVSNLIVVETSDAILVADKTRSQDVRLIFEHLQSIERKEHTLHRKVHRPWGWYDSIDEGSRFKVKRIHVKPGASLSLQKHRHRAEHWVVVTGTAKITKGNKVLTLTENQSTFIPLGVVHRLVNPGTIPLEIIEVQSGSYLGEDDIIRLQDNYGRVE